MGAADSKPLAPQGSIGEVTTVHARDVSVDPCLIKLQSLDISPPLVSPQNSELSLRDIVLRRSPSFSSCSNYGALDPTTTLRLFDLYEEWQQIAAAKLGRNQEGIGDKIEAVEALEQKLMQRLSFAASVIRDTATNLDEVHPLRTEVAQLQRNLQATVETYNSLCARIEELDPSLMGDESKSKQLSVQLAGEPSKEAA
eukprot:TRINITY_DN4506_c0_g3_i1.p1 TRINITY_DN4506_c0_g3~~TRINITY_DN4506_c0_g3_i1.p1  ORF type:complete len:212 (+),score=34.86 TRINITY_DN4506_c0_g3_i1:44-637(+)